MRVLPKSLAKLIAYPVSHPKQAPIPKITKNNIKGVKFAAPRFPLSCSA